LYISFFYKDNKNKHARGYVTFCSLYTVLESVIYCRQDLNSNSVINLNSPGVLQTNFYCISHQHTDLAALKFRGLLLSRHGVQSGWSTFLNVSKQRAKFLAHYSISCFCSQNW